MTEHDEEGNRIGVHIKLDTTHIHGGQEGINMLQSIFVEVFPRHSSNDGPGQKRGGGATTGSSISGVSFVTSSGIRVTSGGAFIDAAPNDANSTDYIESGMLESSDRITPDLVAYWSDDPADGENTLVIQDFAGWDYWNELTNESVDVAKTRLFAHILRQIEDALRESEDEEAPLPPLSALLFHLEFLVWIWVENPYQSWNFEWDLWECVEVTPGGCGGPMFPGGKVLPDDITTLDVMHYDGGWKALAVGKVTEGEGTPSMKAAGAPGAGIPRPPR